MTVILGFGLYTHKLYRKHQIQPDIVIDCPDEYSIAALVAEYFGIALVADVDTIRDAKIAKIPISGQTLIHTVYMAHMKDKYMITRHKPICQIYLKKIPV